MQCKAIPSSTLGHGLNLKQLAPDNVLYLALLSRTCPVISRNNHTSCDAQRDEKVQLSRRKLLTAVGLEQMHHLPDAVDLSSLNDFQRFQSCERRVRTLQPLPDEMWLHEPGQGLL